jgi:hypothetical protein
MTSGTTVPDPDPELINAQNFDFAKQNCSLKTSANMPPPQRTFTYESRSTSQQSSTQNKPLPECFNFWTNTKNRSNQVPNPT